MFKARNKEFSRILVPIDLIQSVDLSIKSPLRELYKMLRGRLRHGSKFKKKPMKTTLSRREIIVNSRSVVGAVVDYAEHEGVDLIVIGSRGLSGFKKIIAWLRSIWSCNVCTLPCVSCKMKRGYTYIASVG
jgi:hypothetical protein